MEPRNNVPTNGNHFTFFLIVFNLSLYDLLHVEKGYQVEILPGILSNLEQELAENMHYQAEAISRVLEGFNQVLNGQNMKVIALIGSTGVGKTFMANIIKNNFNSVEEWRGLRYNNKLQLDTSDSKDFKLIIIDDLSGKDCTFLMNFLQMPHIATNNNIVVMPIFNIQETDDYLNYYIDYKNVDKIRLQFENLSIPYKLAVFHEFDKSQAKHWVEKQSIFKGLSREKQNFILNSFEDFQNVKYHGLKGLHSKISVEL